LSFEFGDPLLQWRDKALGFFGGVARGDVLGTVPIERDYFDEKQTLDDAADLGLGDLSDKLRCLCQRSHCLSASAHIAGKYSASRFGCKRRLHQPAFAEPLVAFGDQHALAVPLPEDPHRVRKTPERPGQCPARVKLVLCVNNCFHSEPKLLSYRLWDANPTPQP
jgi:hypothetical protein